MRFLDLVFTEEWVETTPTAPLEPWSYGLMEWVVSTLVSWARAGARDCVGLDILRVYSLVKTYLGGPAAFL